MMVVMASLQRPSRGQFVVLSSSKVRERGGLEQQLEGRELHKISLSLPGHHCWRHQSRGNCQASSLPSLPSWVTNTCKAWLYILLRCSLMKMLPSSYMNMQYAAHLQIQSDLQCSSRVNRGERSGYAGERGATHQPTLMHNYFIVLSTIRIQGYATAVTKTKLERGGACAENATNKPTRKRGTELPKSAYSARPVHQGEEVARAQSADRSGATGSCPAQTARMGAPDLRKGFVIIVSTSPLTLTMQHR